MPVPWNRALLLLGVCTVAGCAAAAERAHVARRFTTMFQCADVDVRSAGGSHVAEGCGVIAHFTCFDSDDDRERLVEPGSTAALIGAIADGATGRDTCILEHSQRLTRPVAVAPPVHRKQAAAGATLRTRLLYHGGHLLLVGKPAQHPDHALLLVHTAVRRMAPSPCRGALYHDGVSVPIEKVERTGEHDARVLIRVDALADADRSVRFAGAVCGVDFDLDGSSREALGRFHARFLEERTRDEQRVASGGERPAHAADAVPAAAEERR